MGGNNSIVREKLDSLRQDIVKLFRTGLFSILSSNILAKVCATLGSILVVRMLSKADYGFYTRVINDYLMIFMLNDFGCSVAMVQFRGEHFEDRKLRDAYFVEPFKMAVLFSLLVGLLILLSPLYFPYSDALEAGTTRLLFLLPLVTVVNSFILNNLLSLSENGKYAGLYFAQTFLQYLFLVIGSYCYGRTGAVLSGYAFNLALLVVGIILSGNRLRFDWKAKVLSGDLKLSFLKFALSAQFNNTINELLNIFDIFMLGQIIADDTVVAGYKVAATIPRSLRYVSTSITSYALPYFARNIGNTDWVRKNAAKMIAGCTAFCGAITAGAIVLARPVVVLVFGEAYSSSVPCFIILMISFFFTGSFHMPAANVIFSQHKVKVNIVITVIANIANCLLDYVMIKRSGAIGAAIATCLVSVIASVLAVAFMIVVLRSDANAHTVCERNREDVD